MLSAVLILSTVLLTLAIWVLVRCYRNLETRVVNLEAICNRTCERKCHAHPHP